MLLRKPEAGERISALRLCLNARRTVAKGTRMTTPANSGFTSSDSAVDTRTTGDGRAASSAADLMGFCNQVYEEFYDDGGFDTRCESRRPVSLPMRIQPLDEQLQPSGPEMSVVSRDISSAGVGFFVSKPLECPFVNVRMTTPSGRTMHAPAAIKHVTPFGVFCFVGCEFLL